MRKVTFLCSISEPLEPRCTASPSVSSLPPPPLQIPSVSTTLSFILLPQWQWSTVSLAVPSEGGFTPACTPSWLPCFPKGRKAPSLGRLPDVLRQQCVLGLRAVKGGGHSSTDGPLSQRGHCLLLTRQLFKASYPAPPTVPPRPQSRMARTRGSLPLISAVAGCMMVPPPEVASAQRRIWRPRETFPSHSSPSSWGLAL